MDLIAELKTYADPEYNEFNRSLIPGIGNTLGIRMPILRKIAKRICSEDWRNFLEQCENEYYEILIIKAIVIATVKIPISERFEYLEKFIPEINNWAVCDCLCSSWKVSVNEREEVFVFLEKYYESNTEFGMRFAVVAMMSQFLVEDYIDKILVEIDTHDHPGYYYRMGAAWCLSFCFIKFRDKTLDYLRNCNIERFTYNKALQKITESYRVSAEDKILIKSMRRVE